MAAEKSDEYYTQLLAATAALHTVAPFFNIHLSVGIAAFEESEKLPVRAKYSATDMELRLRQATSVGDYKEVITLLSDKHKTINVNSQGKDSKKTALHLAVEKNDFLMVQLLYHKYKADFTIKDKDGKSAEDLAKEMGIKEISDFFEGIKKPLSHIIQRLESIFDQIKLSCLMPTVDLSVLSLACGYFCELPAFEACLKQAEHPSSFQYVGVDNDGDRLRKAHASLSVSREAHRLFIMDACNIKKLKKRLAEQSLPQQFDLIFLRNPEILRPQDPEYRHAFEVMITEVIPVFLKPNGICFLSSYYLPEFIRAAELLLTNPSFKACQENPYFYENPQDPPVDQYYGLFRHSP